MNFLPFAIVGYALNGGATVIDKILLQTRLPNPAVYTFYISLLGLVTLLLIPFGVDFNSQIILPSLISATASTFALFTFFQSLKLGEASISAPLVGALNPLFTFILGSIFLNQILSENEMVAFFTIILGAIILTFNLWSSKLRFNHQLGFILISGLLFAISFLFLKQVFILSNFITGLVVTRTFAGVFVLCFLFSKNLRGGIFASPLKSNNFINKTSFMLLIGQSMGAAQGLLLAFATYLASPALVNSLFGVQYLVILSAALILRKNHPHLLDERLSTGVLAQKIAGAAVLSFGVYLLSKSGLT